MAVDTLIAMRMNMNLRRKQPKMRDGWYINENNEKIVQLMIFPDNHPLKGQPKGIKQVLKKYNLWPLKDIHLICEQCSEKDYDLNPERLDCCT